MRSVAQRAAELSGGNQQKLLLARELGDAPRILVVAQPCQGLDVGAIEFVHRTLRGQRLRGVAILYISTEMEHLLAVCDRVAVIFRGRVAGTVDPESATPEVMGSLMAGLKEERV